MVPLSTVPKWDSSVACSLSIYGTTLQVMKDISVGSLCIFMSSACLICLYLFVLWHHCDACCSLSFTILYAPSPSLPSILPLLSLWSGMWTALEPSSISWTYRFCQERAQRAGWMLEEVDDGLRCARSLPYSCLCDTDLCILFSGKVCDSHVLLSCWHTSI